MPRYSATCWRKRKGRASGGFYMGIEVSDTQCSRVRVQWVDL